MNPTEIFRQVLALDSSTHVGNGNLARHLADLARSWGLEVELDVDPRMGRDQANLLIQIQKSTDVELMLEAHLDTVHPGSRGQYLLWHVTGQDPYNPTVFDQNIYGLGAAKSKLDFVCKMFALKNSSQINLKKMPLLVGTFGGEDDMAGAIRLMRQRKYRIRQALVAAPTSMSLATTSPGYAHIELLIPLTAKERSFLDAHDMGESSSSQSKMFSGPSRFYLPTGYAESAVGRMFEYLKNLPADIAILDLAGGQSFQVSPASVFLEFEITGDPEVSVSTKKLLSVDRFLNDLNSQFSRWEAAKNQVDVPRFNIGILQKFADHIRIEGVCMLPSYITQSDFDIWMKQMTDFADGNGLITRLLEYKKPFSTDANSNFVARVQKGLKSVTGKNELTISHFPSEATAFSRFGVDCILFGAGDAFESAYAANENVPLVDLEHSIKFYEHMIREFCQ